MGLHLLPRLPRGWPRTHPTHADIPSPGGHAAILEIFEALAEPAFDHGHENVS